MILTRYQSKLIVAFEKLDNEKKYELMKEIWDLDSGFQKVLYDHVNITEIIFGRYNVRSQSWFSCPYDSDSDYVPDSEDKSSDKSSE